MQYTIVINFLIKHSLNKQVKLQPAVFEDIVWQGLLCY